MGLRKRGAKGQCIIIPADLCHPRASEFYLKNPTPMRGTTHLIGLCGTRKGEERGDAGKGGMLRALRGIHSHTNYHFSRRYHPKNPGVASKRPNTDENQTKWRQPRTCAQCAAAATSRKSPFGAVFLALVT